MHNLRYYFESDNENVNVRVHYLDARDLSAHAYLQTPNQRDDYRFARHDRVVLLDDPALAYYLRQSSRLPSRDVAAIGINNATLLERAHAQGIPLALTTVAIEESAGLARQITNKDALLLLYSATPAGRQLKQQALEHLGEAGWEQITARTWESVYATGLESKDQAILALDAPLMLARHTPASELADYFQQTLDPLFCYAAYLRDYGCVGGAFINVASLAHLVAHRLTHNETLSQSLDVPLELSLSYSLLDQLPPGIDVKVLDIPAFQQIPRWAWLVILGLLLTLISVAGIAWWRLRRKQQFVDLIAHEAEYDALTHLYNRRKILAVLERMMASEKPVWLLYVDLDGFRDINDTLGHAQGDQLLQGFAKLLRSLAKGRANYGRIGGDEFLILCHQKKHALTLAQRLVRELDNPFLIDNQHLTLRCSIGVVTFPQQAENATQLLHCAEVALYAAKSRDEPIALFTEQMRNDQARHTALAQDLERAIDEGGDQLELHIQPIVSLKRQAIVGGEVLLRWRHPVEGSISPGTFIPIAEGSDLILKLNDWVVKQTIQRLAAEALYRDISYLAINISAKQLYARRFAAEASELAKQYGVPSRALSFEMTEHVRLMDITSVQQQILELRDAGFGVALDDFGAGYTSISFLQQIQFSSVKIDRSLTAGLCSDNADTSRHLMQGLLYLGDRLSKQVIIEGVETLAESDLLQNMGADHVQGYYYYRPMPWEDFTRQVKPSLSANAARHPAHRQQH
ncbi:putative bifunctional diguanylate cyclase/phosphodiesterase [Modicisalibacter xianhensis]|uniref:putative bifunctional diguanylate cyclase/phosphodiesterase n=1 Tax=Modicisalibacter xianhensis TaxID=442341 RepID=UPI001AB02165|nr:bifunctional diguanylate cyclase/phosphodiesterase [Halomonas xianhensis]